MGEVRTLHGRDEILRKDDPMDGVGFSSAEVQAALEPHRSVRTIQCGFRDAVYAKSLELLETETPLTLQSPGQHKDRFEALINFHRATEQEASAKRRR